MSLRVPLEKRFWSKVDKSAGADDCWIWVGAVKSTGYGHIASGGKFGVPLLAHRVSWQLANGPIPDGLLVLHRCDVPLCVNPSHLFLGNCAENTADMIAKGRNPWMLPRAVCKYGHDRVPGSGKRCPVCALLRGGGLWPQFLASSDDERRWLSDLVSGRRSPAEAA